MWIFSEQLALWTVLGGAVGLLILAWRRSLRRGEIRLAELARANRALARRVEELTVLDGVGRDMLGCVEPADIFGTIEDACRRLLPCDECVIDLAAPGESAARRVHPEPGEGPTPEVEAASLLAVPLRFDGQPAGVLGVRSRRAHAFATHDLELLEALAHHASAAIRNALHYRMATVDSMTGLFLRDYFSRRLADECERTERYGGRFALLMLDLDGFKAVNDRHGHEVGDRFLAAIGATILSELRATDLGSRCGGDEFCLLLPETGREGARTIAERIRRGVARVAIDVARGRVSATLSVGIAVFRAGSEQAPEDLLRAADAALYRAKRSGRNRVAEDGDQPCGASLSARTS